MLIVVLNGSKPWLQAFLFELSEKSRKIIQQIYNIEISKNHTHLTPKMTRIRGTAPGKAVEVSVRSTDPQCDQAPVLCPRVFSYAAKAEMVSKTELYNVYWLDARTAA